MKIKILIGFSTLMITVTSCGSVSNSKPKKEKIVVKEKEREYFVYCSKNKSRTTKVLFFLHGLTHPNEVESQLSSLIQAAKNQDSLLIVFPIGLKNAFPSSPEMLGWTPGCFNENVLFLGSILIRLRQEHPLDESTVIAGGFSNGAYFLSQLLQSENSRLFSGFWLQGGGNPQPIPLHLVKKKVFLEVGRSDLGNIESVRELKSHLLENGWQNGSNLFYIELNEGHHLYLKNFEEIMASLAPDRVD